MSKEDSPREAYTVFLRLNEAERIAQELEMGAKSIRSRAKYLQSKLKKYSKVETHQIADEPCCTYQDTALRERTSVTIPRRFVDRFADFLRSREFHFVAKFHRRKRVYIFSLIETRDSYSESTEFISAYSSFCRVVRV